MNKGLDIRNRKITKNLKDMNTVKDGQENVCRFISISYEVIKKVKGKYKRIGSKKVNGLQIKNKVYLIDGRYKMINNKNIRIIKIFDGIPEWSTDELIYKYKNFMRLKEKSSQNVYILYTKWISRLGKDRLELGKDNKRTN